MAILLIILFVSLIISVLLLSKKRKKTEQDHFEGTYADCFPENPFNVNEYTEGPTIDQIYDQVNYYQDMPDEQGYVDMNKLQPTSSYEFSKI